MFSYYGSKSKIVHLYPKPKFDKIIEPFAGSARYALRYFYKDVTIYESFHKVYEVWSYLKNATPKDILSLPNIGYKEKIPNSLSNAEKWLIGFCVGRGSPRPNTMGHKFNSWNTDKKRISENLFKIKHWKILNLDGLTAVNEKATWFIDPPYQKMGYKYNFNKIDYPALSCWCKERSGQVIVCENQDAEWLDFTPLIKFRGAIKTNIEVIWSNYPHDFEAVQNEFQW